MTLAMQAVLQQILRCPYQGLTKRIFLESKVLEWMALLLEEEKEVKECRDRAPSLKPEDIDLIDRAKKILLQNLENPPSLMEG